MMTTYAELAAEATAHNRAVEEYNRKKAERKQAERDTLRSRGLARRKWSSLRVGDRVDTNAGPAEIVQIDHAVPQNVTELVHSQAGTNPFRNITVRVGDQERTFRVDTRSTINAYVR